MITNRHEKMNHFHQVKQENLKIGNCLCSMQRKADRFGGLGFTLKPQLPFRIFYLHCADPSRLATTRFLCFFWLGDLERVFGHIIQIFYSARHNQLPRNVCEHLLDALTSFT